MPGADKSIQLIDLIILIVILDLMRATFMARFMGAHKKAPMFTRAQGLF